jgi:hypothetical protein
MGWRLPTGNAVASILTHLIDTGYDGDAYTFAEFQSILARAGFLRGEFHTLPPTMQQAVVSYQG